MLCILLDSYDHLVITLTYEKDIVHFDVIITTLFFHSQRIQYVEEQTQHKGLYVNGEKIKGETKLKQVLKKEV